jgi:hypothetical protein
MHVMDKVAVVSCHLERPLDDRCWAAFSALQAARPGGFEIAALMRPPADGESESLWLPRGSRHAGPLGHHHPGGAEQARPTDGDRRAVRHRPCRASAGSSASLLCGGGWYMDEAGAARRSSATRTWRRVPPVVPRPTRHERRLTSRGARSGATLASCRRPLRVGASAPRSGGCPVRPRGLRRHDLLDGRRRLALSTRSSRRAPPPRRAARQPGLWFPRPEEHHVEQAPGAARTGPEGPGPSNPGEAPGSKPGREHVQVRRVGLRRPAEQEDEPGSAGDTRSAPAEKSRPDEARGASATVRSKGGAGARRRRRRSSRPRGRARRAAVASIPSFPPAKGPWSTSIPTTSFPRHKPVSGPVAAARSSTQARGRPHSRNVSARICRRDEIRRPVRPVWWSW